MRRAAFAKNGRPVPNGRFGFTEWQQELDGKLAVAWLSPDILSAELSKLPLPSFQALSRSYIGRGWQRRQEPYARDAAAYWSWFTEEDPE